MTKPPSKEKIERTLSKFARAQEKLQVRAAKNERRREAAGMEPVLLAGIAGMAFVIGFVVGCILVAVLL